MSDINVIAQEVLRLDAEATTGPWERRQGSGMRSLAGLGSGCGIYAHGCGNDCHTCNDWSAPDRGCPMERCGENTDLIAHYRTAAPALAREVLQLQADLRDLRERVRAGVAYEMQQHWLKRGRGALRLRELDDLQDRIVSSILGEEALAIAEALDRLNLPVDLEPECEGEHIEEEVQP